ncbi:hypothetical protein [Oryza sativa Japonica Group]|uniref:Uncharacterized protein n=1 Tax=Oryza sativa subsp. japonica TaxID=39947 RepID=Q5NAW4_ORYSJ|nr:hypothetical protein [Oryza sativa Japonica Group]
MALSSASASKKKSRPLLECPQPQASNDGGGGAVRFCVNFGDIVDGFCPKDRSLLAVQAVVAEFDRFLDAYDFNAVGWSRDHPMAAAAGRFLDKRNPNTDKNNPSGLAGVARRFVMFNGAVCEAQLRWLDGVLRGRCCGGKLRWCAGTCRYTSARHHCQG